MINPVASNLEKCANREVGSAFFEGTPGYKQTMFGNHSKQTKYDFAGLILHYDDNTYMVAMQQRYFNVVEFFGPEIDNFTETNDNIRYKKSNQLEAEHYPLQFIRFKADRPECTNSMMREEN